MSPGVTRKRLDLTMEYDSGANMAYLNLAGTAAREPLGPRRTERIDLPRWARGDLVIDFDAKGRILGIEFLNVSKQFSADFVSRLRGAKDVPDRGR